MKVEQKEIKFNPVVITLESIEEVWWLKQSLDGCGGDGEDRGEFYDELYEKLEKVK